MQTTTFPVDGWQGHAGTGVIQSISAFTASYIVPKPPPSGADAGLGYYIGLQTAGNGGGILQPVLAWDSTTLQWKLTSWDCCPANVTTSTSHLYGASAGDEILANITRLDSTTWKIRGTIVKTGEYVELNNNLGPMVYDTADVTEEVHHINSCSQFPAGPIVFKNLQLYNDKGKPMSPSWHIAPPISNPPACDASVTMIGSTVTMSHNPNATGFRSIRKSQKILDPV